MFLSLIIAAFFFLPSSVHASDFNVSELPIKIEIQEITKLPENLQTVNFTPLEIKKAAKVLGTSTNLDDLFNRFSNEYSVDKNLLLKIADCESHFHPGSVNGDYGGMFQFSAGTWVATRAQMGEDSNPDLRFSAEQAIKTAAFKISRGGASAWSGCL